MCSLVQCVDYPVILQQTASPFAGSREAPFATVSLQKVGNPSLLLCLAPLSVGTTSRGRVELDWNVECNCRTRRLSIGRHRLAVCRKHLSLFSLLTLLFAGNKCETFMDSSHLFPLETRKFHLIKMVLKLNDRCLHTDGGLCACVSCHHSKWVVVVCEFCTIAFSARCDAFNPAPS